MSEDEHQAQYQTNDGNDITVTQMQSVSEEPLVTEAVRSLLFHGCPSCGMPISLNLSKSMMGRREAVCPSCDARFKRKAFRRKWLCTEGRDHIETKSYTAHQWEMMTEMRRIERLGEVIAHVEEHGIGDYDK